MGQVLRIGMENVKIGKNGTGGKNWDENMKIGENGTGVKNWDEKFQQQKKWQCFGNVRCNNFDKGTADRGKSGKVLDTAGGLRLLGLDMQKQIFCKSYLLLSPHT